MGKYGESGKLRVENILIMNELGYILAIPKPLLRRGWGGLFYHLGSTSFVTDYEGNVSQSVMYAPFGEVISEYKRGFDNDYITDYLFNGKELDEETGMYYYSQRYYDPTLPMFISRDPLEEKYPGISPYAYCANNPLRYIDPDGRQIDITESIDGNGKTNINIHFTASLRNKSSKNLSDKELGAYAGMISTALKDRYGGTKDDGTIVNVTTDIAYRTDETRSDELSRHSINIVDQKDLTNLAKQLSPSPNSNTALGLAEDNGKSMYLSANTLNNSVNYKSDASGWLGTFERTAAHEFGHLAGLTHDAPNGNLMLPGSHIYAGITITGSQIHTMKNLYNAGQLNRGIFIPKGGLYSLPVFKGGRFVR